MMVSACTTVYHSPRLRKCDRSIEHVTSRPTMNVRPWLGLFPDSA
ncbi:MULTISPECIES: hypothetical protein [unclassified Nostoc]|nr:hypothetical protein [Nostoc sp. 'Peltigera membranacea cyanobiont' 213]